MLCPIFCTIIMEAAFISAEIVQYRMKENRKPKNLHIFAFLGINSFKICCKRTGNQLHVFSCSRSTTFSEIVERNEFSFRRDKFTGL